MEPDDHVDPCCCCLFSSMVMLILMVFSSFIASELACQGGLLPSISVACASVFALHASSSSISGEWNISFDVHTTTRCIYDGSFYYKGIQALVYYKQTIVSQTSLAPFQQADMEQTTLRATFAAGDGVYVDPSVVSALNAERAASGSVEFTVEFVTFIASDKREDWVLSRCWSMRLAFPQNSNNGTLVGIPSECIPH